MSFVLDDGDAIRGKAAVASKVDYTLFGLDGTTFKQLANGQLGTSEADLYLASGVDVVATIILVNTDTSTRAVNLYFKASGGTARQISPTISLGAGYSLHTDGKEICVYDTSGELQIRIGVDISGTPVANDYARFTDADTVAGRSYAEVKADLSLNLVENTAHSTDAHTMTIDGRDVSVDGTKLDGVEALADVTDAVNVGTSIHGVANKATPIDADKFPLIDTAAANVLKTSTGTNIKAYLKTYFDTLYNKYVHPNHSGEVTSAADGAQTITADAVTYAKMQNVSATDKVLGRSTAGAGNVEEIACTTFARSILDDANEATFKATVNLEIGTDVLAQQTIGIADNNLLEVDQADAATGEYAKFTATGIESKSLAEALADISPLTTRGDIAFRNATITTRLAKGTAGQVLVMGADDPAWGAAGSGDVTGPGASIDNAIVRFNSTTGKIIQDYTSNPPTVGDTGDMNIDGDLDVENIVVSGTVDGRDVSVDGTKLDGVEALADVTDATNVNAAGAVMEADFNAQTVLAATTDDTPAALTVGEQTVVGRITGGNIAALTVAQLATLALSGALPENTAIILDAALSADGKYSGIVETGTAGAILAFGDLVYYAVADSRWELTDADAAATAFGKIGICVQAAADAAATTILLWGKVRADTAFPALTIGAPVHVGSTPGDVEVATPAKVTNKVVRIIGYGNTADELFFCPDNTYLEYV